MFTGVVQPVMRETSEVHSPEEQDSKVAFVIVTARRRSGLAERPSIMVDL